MKRVYTMIIGGIFAVHAYAQTNGDENKIPKQSSPANLANYRMTINSTNNRISEISVCKIIQRSQQSYSDNAFQLADVHRTEISEQGQNTRKLEDLEGLNIKILDDNFTKLDFYKDVPPAHVEYVRMLVQDKFSFDIWGQMYLDSLRLNVPFYPDLFQNQ